MRRTPAGMEIDEMKRIVVDSSASLYALDGIDFAAVPLKIVTDEREYLDDGTLDAVEMATTLRTYKGKTSTSCPNIGDWLEAYEGADEIYAITITGTLSGSCNAAQLAAEEYQAEHPGAHVFVLDSLSAGPELVLLAEHIRALIQEGREFDDVCEEMLRYRHHTHLLFSLESLASLIYIVLSKNVLSLENIDALFQMQRAHCTAAEAYDYFCDEVENCLPFIFGASRTIRDLDPDAADEKRLLRGTIVAAVNKMYLDCCFVAMRQEQALWPGILGDLQ